MSETIDRLYLLRRVHARLLRSARKQGRNTMWPLKGIQEAILVLEAQVTGPRLPEPQTPGLSQDE